jgi:hypothetical protein
LYRHPRRRLRQALSRGSKRPSIAVQPASAKMIEPVR